MKCVHRLLLILMRGRSAGICPVFRDVSSAMISAGGQIGFRPNRFFKDVARCAE